VSFYPQLDIRALSLTMPALLSRPSTDDSAEEEDQTLVVKPAGDAQGSIQSDAGLST
jgi:hypothetical protein